MKKFFSLILASTAVASAIAAAPQDGLRQLSSVRTERAVADLPSWPTQVSLAPTSQNLVYGMRKADATASLEGWWTFYLGDFYFQTSVGGYIPAIYEATLDGNNVTFTPQDDTIEGTDIDLMTMAAVYDEETNTVTFSKRYYGRYANTYYVFQEPFHFTNEELVSVENIKAKFSPEDFIITFPEDYGLRWEAYDSMTGTGEGAGAIAAYDLLQGYAFNPYASLEGEWEVVGNVTFFDPWLVPALPSDYQKDNGYGVLFEQNVDEPGKYRLVNPYKSGPVAEFNRTTYDGYIVIDMTDPQHVIVLPADAGFSNPNIIEGGRISSFYCYNALGYLANTMPMTPVEDIVRDTDYIPFTVYNEATNTITFGSLTQQGQTAYDANFGYQLNPYGGQFWGDGIRMTGSIVFPTWYNAAVGAVGVDEEANPEYFNLNGIRVTNPEPGQILIRKAGGKVTKVIL